jgi:hypothetical protein
MVCCADWTYYTTNSTSQPVLLTCVHIQPDSVFMQLLESVTDEELQEIGVSADARAAIAAVIAPSQVRLVRATANP